MMIRRATVDDAPVLARLNAHVQGWHADHYPEAFFPHPDPADLADWFKDRLSQPDCTAFLADQPATAYALCQLQTRDRSIFSPGYRRLMIEHIAVVPDARRKGQGRALLQAARTLARSLNADEILLDTWEANKDAHAFFRTEGFSPRRMLFRSTP